MAQAGEENPRSVLATTILSYSFSSVLTGLVFFAMGQCRLGLLIGFFPRHILIGCIGGVGFFLVVTGLEVSARLEGNFDYSLETLQKLVRPDTIPLWVIPLALAFTLFLVKRWVKHSLTDACFFLAIFVIFYIMVAAVPDLKLINLRSTGWVFDAPPASIPWYHFYSLYGVSEYYILLCCVLTTADFSAVNWKALASTVPAMLALTLYDLDVLKGINVLTASQLWGVARPHQHSSSCIYNR